MAATTNNPVVFPPPVSLELGEGLFPLPEVLTISPGAPNVAWLLDDALGRSAGIRVQESEEQPLLKIDFDPSQPSESYRLTIETDRVLIVAADPAGAGWAAQTLLQLLPVQAINDGPVAAERMAWPVLSISDAPAYPWRGTMIDLARHFLDIDGLKQHIKVMAMHKLNVLQLHLSDDQGWRFPVAAYPKLAEVAAWRPGTFPGHLPVDEEDSQDMSRHDSRPHGGCFTREELAELVDYAAGLGVRIIPEVDMPGHMEAAVAAYPQLGHQPLPHPRTVWGISEHVLMLVPEALDFVRTVLDELLLAFPEVPIHVGGDECPGNEWLVDEGTKRTMAEVGATTPAEAQAWFEQQVLEHLKRSGREMVAWDEVVDGGVSPEVIVTAWRGKESAVRALEAGHRVVSAPTDLTYLDYAQSDHPDEPLTIGGHLTLADAFDYADELARLRELGGERLLGGQFQLWTEYVRNWASAHYQLWPRGTALAEQLWTGRRLVDEVPLRAQLDRLSVLGVGWRHPRGTGLHDA